MPPPPPSSRVPPPPGARSAPPPKAGPARSTNNGNAQSDVTEVKKPLGIPDGDEIEVDTDELLDDK
jgi:hypothetical protein